MTIFEKLVNRSILKMAESEIRNAIITENAEIETKAPYTKEGVLFNIKENGIQLILDALSKTPSPSLGSLNIHNTFKIHTVPLPQNMKQDDKLKLYIKLMNSTYVYGIIGFDNTNTPWNISNPITHGNPLFKQAKITKLAIYSYNHEQSVKPETVSSYIKYFATIDSVINTYSYLRKEKKSETVGVESLAPSYWDLQNSYRTVGVGIITYKNNVLLPSTESGEYTLIPHLFVAKGVIAPYYGFSYMVSTPTYKKGYALSRMFSANISQKSFKVCVGSNPPNMYDSYRTLNYSNLDSAYQQNIFPDNYASIAEASKQYTILKIKGVLNGDQTETSS